MDRKEILYKIQNDIDFIPTIEEIELIGTSQFSIGSTPIFKLNLMDQQDKTKINDIKKATSGNVPEGLHELYNQLEAQGYCESYSDSKIFYLAYILAEAKIDINIEGLEYRNKLKVKSNAIQRVLKQLGWIKKE